MTMRFAVCVLVFAAFALAQGTVTKAKPTEYPVSGTVDTIGIGADYSVQSVSSPKGSFIADKFLVVDIAVFPPDGGMTISHSSFALRVNGKTLMAQTPSMVAASLKYPDWNQQRGLQVGAGPVIIGRPSPVERFPGDNRPAQSRLPGPVPRAPTDPNNSTETPVDINELVNAATLPEGPRKQPVSGYVFFPYDGKLTKIKTVTLLVRFQSAEYVPFRLR